MVDKLKHNIYHILKWKNLVYILIKNTNVYPSCITKVLPLKKFYEILKNVMK